MKNKIAVVVGLFLVMLAGIFQGWDKSTIVSLSATISIVSLLPVRWFRRLGPLLTIIALVTLGPVGCVTKNNITSKAVTPGPWGTNIVTHEDKSWSVNQFGSSVNHSGNLFHFRAAVGGGAPEVGGRYGYNVGPGGYGYHVGQGGNGYPMITVPIESQRFYQEQTWRRYGFSGGSGGGGGGVGRGGYGHQNQQIGNNVGADIQKFNNLSGPGGSGPRGYGY